MSTEPRQAWERFFATDRSLARRALVSALLATLGFAAAYEAHRVTGFYFTSIIVTAVVAISLYGGGALAVVCAVFLSLAADYFFIPPVGTVLNTHAGWEHFAIIVTIALAVAFVGASLRGAFKATVVAKQEAERAKLAAEEASRMMETMLALVSHDVRNPLATVKMAVQVLVDPSSDKQREARAVILRNLERADGIIQSLLDVASIRAGRPIPLEFRSCDLAAEVRRVAAEEVVVGHNRVELVARDELRGEWAVGGIVRALQNLIGNAVKYGAPETPIVVRLERQDGHALLSVHNEGEPISPEDQRAIFRPFQRTARSERSSTKGWGLGLAIVQAVAEAHGGRATVESFASSGTTFTLDLPIRS